MNTLFQRFLLFLQLLSEFKYIFCCTYPRISTWVCSDVPSDSCSQINPFLSSEFLLFFLFSNNLWLASEFELRCSFFSSTPNLWEYVLYSCHCSTVCGKAVCRCKFISSQQLAIRLMSGQLTDQTLQDIFFSRFYIGNTYLFIFWSVIFHGVFNTGLIEKSNVIDVKTDQTS